MNYNWNKPETFFLFGFQYHSVMTCIYLVSSVQCYEVIHFKYIIIHYGSIHVFFISVGVCFDVLVVRIGTAYNVWYIVGGLNDKLDTLVTLWLITFFKKTHKSYGILLCMTLFELACLRMIQQMTFCFTSG